MSAADIESLDRGVLEAGQLAAEALSRVEALETKPAQMETAFEIIGRCGRVDVAAAMKAARQPEPQAARKRRAAQSGLTVVRS